LNAHFLGDRIAQHAQVNLGVAVDTSRGLMVPVVTDAGRLSLRELSAAIKSRAEDCQKGSINPDLLAGGTFTITNLGALGVETFTPVLNAPEVAILGVGGLAIKPVRKDGSIALVDAITLSLTIDHQAVDGAPGARFLKELCEKLESIETLLKD
jgi:pyruvate dehydrogenase E2 component (dihydrolipoamide acetyltransferase)